MPEQDLMAEVAALNLHNPQQRDLVEREISNNERALYGEPMRYSGGDFGAQSYSPVMHEGTERGHITNEMDRINRRPAPEVPEPELLRHNLERDQHTLALGRPPDYSTHKKNLIRARYDEELPKYLEGYMSHGQMWDANVGHVHHHMRHSEVNQMRAKFLANARKILDPHEEDFSLDELRPHDVVRINSAAFRRNFDQINWTPPNEMERQVSELDNETYYQFLELKAKTNDSSVIMTKLMIDRATYEACEARLNAKHADLGEADQDAPNTNDLEVVQVPEEHIEAVIQHVMMHPNLNYRGLLKGAPLKDYDMQVSEFAKALKEATNLGFLSKDAGNKYVLATDLTEPVGQEMGADAVVPSDE